MVEKTSEKILKRLRDKAQQMSRPDVRNATIDRLVKACNAIESGVAAGTVKTATGKDGGLRYNPKIHPSNVEKYVKSCGKQDQNWTGPTRVTIQKDADLLGYVEAREDERTKPVLPKRPTSRRRQIEEAISTLPSTEIRMELRHELEAGRSAQRELDILKDGLRNIPGIDLHAILNPSESGTGLIATSDNGSVETSNLSQSDHKIVLALFSRLTDNDALKRFDVEFCNDRVRQIHTREQLVKRDEILALKRLCQIRLTEGDED